nr:DUF6301 family protein [Nocardia pseudobrasiliensis]
MPSAGEQVSDSFSALSTALTAIPGAPNRHEPGVDATIGWNLPNVVVNLSAIPNVISLAIVNPEYQAWLDEPEDE